jgi:hypothetical protein
MEKKPEKNSEMQRAAMCTCFCASHAYATQASGRATAAGFVLSMRIYKVCVYIVINGGFSGTEAGNGDRTSGK